MDTAGEVLNDLAQYLGITDLSSTVDFPDAMAGFAEVLQRVSAPTLLSPTCALGEGRPRARLICPGAAERGAWMWRAGVVAA